MTAQGPDRTGTGMWSGGRPFASCTGRRRRRRAPPPPSSGYGHGPGPDRGAARVCPHLRFAPKPGYPFIRTGGTAALSARRHDRPVRSSAAATSPAQSVPCMHRLRRLPERHLAGCPQTGGGRCPPAARTILWPEVPVPMSDPTAHPPHSRLRTHPLPRSPPSGIARPPPARWRRCRSASAPSGPRSSAAPPANGCLVEPGTANAPFPNRAGAGSRPLATGTCRPGGRVMAAVAPCGRRNSAVRRRSTWGPGSTDPAPVTRGWAPPRKRIQPWGAVPVLADEAVQKKFWERQTADDQAVNPSASPSRNRARPLSWTLWAPSQDPRDREHTVCGHRL